MKEKIQNMPILVFVFLGFAIAAYMYMSNLDSFTNLNNQIAQLNTQLKDKQAAYIKAQNASAEIPALKQELENLSQTLQRASELMPANLNLKMVLEKLSMEAQGTGVKMTKSKPGTPETKNIFETFPVEVEFEGSYAQLALFLYQISKDKMIMHPMNMDLSLKEIIDGQANLKMSGRLIAFRYKEAK